MTLFLPSWQWCKALSAMILTYSTCSSLLCYFSSSVPAPHSSLLPDARCAIPSSYHHHHHHRSQLHSVQATSFACKHPSVNSSIYDRPSFDRPADNWSFHKPPIHDRSSHDRLEHWNPNLRVNSENPSFMLDQEEVLYSTQHSRIHEIWCWFMKWIW